MLDGARAADAGPFESIWVYDHFHTVPAPTRKATHEAWSLMAALAAGTGTSQPTGGGPGRGAGAGSFPESPAPGADRAGHAR
jgi:hypothetical protein